MLRPVEAREGKRGDERRIQERRERERERKGVPRVARNTRIYLMNSTQRAIYAYETTCQLPEQVAIRKEIGGSERSREAQEERTRAIYTLHALKCA